MSLRCGYQAIANQATRKCNGRARLGLAKAAGADANIGGVLVKTGVRGPFSRLVVVVGELLGRGVIKYIEAWCAWVECDFVVESFFAPGLSHFHQACRHHAAKQTR